MPLLPLPPVSVSDRIFVPMRTQGAGTNSCSVAAIRPVIELEGEAEADIVVAVVRRVVVAIGGTAVLPVVVPVAAAHDAVVALWSLTFFIYFGVFFGEILLRRHVV